jgi:large conductance mechanosensitive channel
MLKEFRSFVLRGNVVDLAVGLVIGAAFGAIVTSFVDNLLSPLIGSIGGENFGKLFWEVNGVKLYYGKVINSIVSFLLIATAVFFLIVKPINELMERFKTQPEVESPTKSCTECLSNIPAKAKRCAFCTSLQS